MLSPMMALSRGGRVAPGWQGHEYIGSIAWDLLNPTARAHVTKPWSTQWVQH